MSKLSTINYQRYLKAKETIDDRTLDRHVWTLFTQTLRRQNESDQLRFLEVGGGIGSMLKRILRLGLPDPISYVLVDEQSDNIKSACNHFTDSSQYKTSYHTLNFLAYDFKDWVAQYNGSLFNVLILQSILDLVQVDELINLLEPQLLNQFLIYAPNNFDGLSHFLPCHDLDNTILKAYHASMNQHNRFGANTGRQLPDVFRKHNLNIKAIGSSDWTVLGNPDDRSYPHDEAYFLRCILYFVEQSLKNYDDISSKDLNSWLSARHQQIEAGELIYIAHQLDLLVGSK